MKETGTIPVKIVNLSTLVFETDKPQHEVDFPLGDEGSFYTLRRNFTRLQLVYVTGASLQAGEFASKEAQNLGHRVKNAQIVIKGHVVANEELAAFKAALENTETPFVPELSEEQFLMNVETRYEMGTTGQRKGQKTLEEWIPSDSLVRNTLVVDGKTTEKEDGYCTGPVRDVAKQILRAVREGVCGDEWLTIMKPHEDDGYVRTQDFTSKASSSENQSVKKDIEAAEAGTATNTGDSGKEGDL